MASAIASQPVQFGMPLGRGWERMKELLFRPFDLGRWFVIGFGAWLAGLGDGCAGGGGPRGGVNIHHPGQLREAIHDVPRTLTHTWDRLAAHLVWAPVVILVIAIVIAVVVLVLWLSSRGKFIFLDNVVTGRAAVAQPWRDYARRGNSLFLWRLGFVAVTMVLLAGLVAVMVASLVGHGPARIVLAVIAGLCLLALAVGAAYVNLFLDSFVVPVMYRFDLSTTQAWAHFLPWFSSHPWAFVGYGLFVLVLAVAVGVVIVTVGLLTCCVGLILVALPYVGTVILLPVLVTYRAFSLEFLGQLHDDLRLLPTAAQPATAPAVPGSGGQEPE